MELVLIFVVFIGLANFFKIVNVIRAFSINTLMNDKVLTIFLVNQCVITVRAFERIRFRESIILWRESSRANFAQNLSFRAVVLIEIRLRCITTRTGTVVTDVTNRTTINWFDFLTILPFEIRDVVIVVPFLIEDDFRKFINLEFLILRGMGVIEGPLLKRNISTDKV